MRPARRVRLETMALTALRGRKACRDRSVRLALPVLLARKAPRGMTAQTEPRDHKVRLAPLAQLAPPVRPARKVQPVQPAQLVRKARLEADRQTSVGWGPAS